MTHDYGSKQYQGNNSQHVKDPTWKTTINLLGTPHFGYLFNQLRKPDHTFVVVRSRGRRQMISMEQAAHWECRQRSDNRGTVPLLNWAGAVVFVLRLIQRNRQPASQLSIEQKRIVSSQGSAHYWVHVSLAEINRPFTVCCGCEQEICTFYLSKQMKKQRRLCYGCMYINFAYRAIDDDNRAINFIVSGTLFT